MDSIAPKEKWKEMVSKYKYPILVLLVGVGLMLIPQQKEESAAPVPAAEELTMEDRLEQILSGIDGAGQVMVLLAENRGPETLYQTDTRADQSDTVLVTGSDRTETGLVRRTDPPEYLGAVVVCQGAEDPGVRLAISGAVSCATGLGADQISIVKMK